MFSTWVFFFQLDARNASQFALLELCMFISSAAQTEIHLKKRKKKEKDFVILCCSADFALDIILLAFKPTLLLRNYRREAGQLHFQMSDDSQSLSEASFYNFDVSSG